MKSLATVIVLFAFLLGVPLSASAQYGGEDWDGKEYVNVQAGWEVHSVELFNQGTGEVQGANTGKRAFNTNSSPVFSFTTKLEFGPCFDEDDEFCFGLGNRISGDQRRMEGAWFPLKSFPDLDPYFFYNGNRFAYQLLFGALMRHQPILAIGLEAGIVNYDLLVSSGNTILVRDFGEWHTTLVRSLHLNLGAIYYLTVGSFKNIDDENNLLLEALSHITLSLSETFPGNEVLTVPAYADQPESDVDFRTVTSRIVLWWDF